MTKIAFTYSVHYMNDSGQKEEQLTLELLDAIGKNSKVSQRHLAREMGIALGLANSYLKRCLRIGLIKINTAPANRYLYYLTPKGFAEKSRLTAKYLSHSFSFYRQASESCRRAYHQCSTEGWNRVVLCGASDLAEIASLRAKECEITIVGIYDPGYIEKTFLEISVITDHADANPEVADAYILTDYRNPVESYKKISDVFDKDRIIVPDILSIDQ